MYKIKTRGGDFSVRNATRINSNFKELLRTAFVSTDEEVEETLCYGGLVYITGTATISLPKVVEGMAIAIIADATAVVTVAPDAGDIIRLDGVDKLAGVSAVSPGILGDICRLSYHSEGKWYMISNEWA